jgi:hypothetical protein
MGGKMKTIIIAAAVIVLLTIGIFSVMALTKQAPTTEIVKAKTGCSCANKCTADNNCGLQSCAAVSGSGGCGCNKA